MNGATQQVVTTGYSVDGRIKSAGFEHDGVIQQFAYGYLPGSHLLQSLAMPNGVVLTQSYEGKRDLLTDMVYMNNETVLAKRTYSYDAIGRPTARGWLQGESRRDDVFAYNNRSELIGATLGQQGYSYAYDNIGNRESAQEADEKATTYSTNELNQYTVIQEDEHGVFEPQFDAAGNQTLVKTKTGIWRVIYNAENRPVKFTSEDGSIVVECAYDYMGCRAFKRVITNGKVTLHQRYIYCGYLQIAAHDLLKTNHPALWHIIWDPTQPVATRPLAIRKENVWYTYGWDLTKNICEVYGQTGYIRTLYTYTPYGEVTAEGNMEQPIQWSSEFNDEELGLVYYNYRHYSSHDGRWLSRDAIFQLTELNTYAGTSKNSPLSRTK